MVRLSNARSGRRHLKILSKKYIPNFEPLSSIPVIDRFKKVRQEDAGLSCDHWKNISLTTRKPVTAVAIQFGANNFPLREARRTAGQTGQLRGNAKHFWSPCGKNAGPRFSISTSISLK